MLAVVSGFLFLLTTKALLTFETAEGFAFNLISNVWVFVQALLLINIGLALFNLIPIPPLDGSRLLGLILPPKLYYKMLQHERRIHLAIIIWLLLGRSLLDMVRKIPIVQSTPWLYSASIVLSITDMLGVAISTVADWIISLWSLLPIFG